MAEDPSPPPQEEQEEQESELYPFMDAAAGGGPGLTIRAGWADQESGEPEELVVEYSGSAGSPASMEMYEAALEWYRDVVTALARSGREGEGGD